jgi:hypothetical protein
MQKKRVTLCFDLIGAEQEVTRPSTKKQDISITVDQNNRSKCREWHEKQSR